MSTIFTQISAMVLIKFFVPQVRHLFEGGTSLNIVTDNFTFLHFYSTVHFLSVNFPMD